MSLCSRRIQRIEISEVQPDSILFQHVSVFFFVSCTVFHLFSAASCRSSCNYAVTLVQLPQSEHVVHEIRHADFDPCTHRTDGACAVPAHLGLSPEARLDLGTHFGLDAVCRLFCYFNAARPTGLRKAIDSRFQLLMVTMAKLRSAISAPENSGRSASNNGSGACVLEMFVTASVQASAAHSRGLKKIGVVPDQHAIDTLQVFAVLQQIARVHVDAKRATIDLRRA